MADSDEEDEARLRLAIELSMAQESAMEVEPEKSDEAVSTAANELRRSLRAAGVAAPDSILALVKDVSTLIKLLRNPADNPDEPKFKKIKLANPTIARVLAPPGARRVLEACTFSEVDQFLELGEATVPVVARLCSAVEAVEGAQHMLQEMYWLNTTWQEVPSLASLPWSADGAAKAIVQTCLKELNAPTSGAIKAPWVRRLHYMLTAAEMQECRAWLVVSLSGVAVQTVRKVALELIKEGGFELETLVYVNQCFAQLCPPGVKETLDARLDFCYAYLEAALPEDDELMELKLKLTKDDLLGSTISYLSTFSEMGVRCGVLKQELMIEYRGEEGEDAGGLRRQFFDRFTNELKASALWTLTSTGGLRPADMAGRGEPALWAEGGAARAHMETCGRVCGMALYQELHRRLGVEAYPQIYAHQPPNLFGDAFARYFIRVVQHDPPTSLAELQAELQAESLEASADYRAGSAILTKSLAESGLEDSTFVRTVELGGGASCDVPLVEGGAEKKVTEQNKLEWLQALLQGELVEGYAEAAFHFRKGFLDVVGSSRVDAADADKTRWTTPHFFMLTAEELQLQWSGAPVGRACIDELRRIAVVHPEVRVQAGWLWDIMYSLDDEKRAKYYRFVTGSSRRPSAGFSDFKIGPKEGGDGAYPFAHTCFNAVDMPSYTSLPVLLERLDVAVETAHDKFTDY